MENGDLESVEVTGFKDSITVPTIFVSPCNSENEMAIEEMQMILLKAQDIANEIIGRAIDINTGVGMQGEQDTMTVGSDKGESLVSMQAREMVHGIIEHALALSMGPGLTDPEAVDNLPDAKDVFSKIESENNLTPIQSQILSKAKSMVHSAVTRATNLNTERRHSLNTAFDSDYKLDLVESDLMMYKAQAIVSKVVQRAIELNMGRILALYSETVLSGKDGDKVILVQQAKL